MHFLPHVRRVQARWKVPQLRRRAAAPPVAARFVAGKVPRFDQAGSQAGGLPVEPTRDPLERQMIRGSCLCGKVSYEIRGSPQTMYYCHCSMCRKATGSSFATNMLVRAEDFVVLSGREAIKPFLSSPGEHRNFCSECGSPIYGEALKRKGVVSVRCGTLDTDPVVRPSAHIYADSKSPWFIICDQLPQVSQQVK
jgi:hypothetical protein